MGERKKKAVREQVGCGDKTLPVCVVLEIKGPDRSVMGWPRCWCIEALGPQISACIRIAHLEGFSN